MARVGRSEHTARSARHTFAIAAGTIAGSMLVSFVGFIGALTADLVFKIVVDVVAACLLVALGRAVYARPAGIGSAPLENQLT